MLGYPLAEWEQDSYFWYKHVHPDDYEHAAHIIHTVLSHGSADAEYRMLARDGRVVWVRDECVLIRDAAGQPFFVQGFLMDGREALQQLRRLDPNVPVLVMSGYSDLEVSARFAGMGASGFIQKPFHPRDLIAMMYRMTPSNVAINGR